jgi:hypothetical protein
MFHKKIKLLDDKQYYYEFKATGMDQKGVIIKKVIILLHFGICFLKKNIFLLYFINLGVLLDRGHKYQRAWG